MTHPMIYAGLDERGRLTPMGRLRLLGQSLALRWRRGSTRAPVQLAIERPRPPTSASARRALLWSEQASPPWLHAHVLRTWSWAHLIGQAAGLRPDPELLFIACVLHDLGLTELYAPDEGECFAFAGARHARRLLEAEGLAAPIVQQVVDAIALHLEVRLSLRQSVETRLLRDGSGFDVLGRGGEGIPPELQRAVLRDYSRDGFGGALAERLRLAARTAPASRMAMYCRGFDFAGRAERARLAEEGAA